MTLVRGKPRTSGRGAVKKEKENKRTSKQEAFAATTLGVTFYDLPEG